MRRAETANRSGMDVIGTVGGRTIDRLRSYREFMASNPFSGLVEWIQGYKA